MQFDSEFVFIHLLFCIQHFLEEDDNLFYLSNGVYDLLRSANLMKKEIFPTREPVKF